jgi:hypothetical protein
MGMRDVMSEFDHDEDLDFVPIPWEIAKYSGFPRQFLTAAWASRLLKNSRTNYVDFVAELNRLKLDIPKELQDEYGLLGISVSDGSGAVCMVIGPNGYVIDRLQNGELKLGEQLFWIEGTNAHIALHHLGKDRDDLNLVSDFQDIYQRDFSESVNDARKLENWFSFFGACQQVCERDNGRFEPFAKIYSNEAFVQIHVHTSRNLDGGSIFVDLNAFSGGVRFDSSELAAAVFDTLLNDENFWALA